MKKQYLRYFPHFDWIIRNIKNFEKKSKFWKKKKKEKKKRKGEERREAERGEEREGEF